MNRIDKTDREQEETDKNRYMIIGARINKKESVKYKSNCIDQIGYINLAAKIFVKRCIHNFYLNLFSPPNN